VTRISVKLALDHRIIIRSAIPRPLLINHFLFGLPSGHLMNKSLRTSVPAPGFDSAGGGIMHQLARLGSMYQVLIGNESFNVLV
jgi:hypothetical protein